MMFHFSHVSRCRLAGTLLLLTAFCIVGCGIAREAPYVEEEQEEKVVDNRELKRLDPGDYMQTWQMDDGRIVSFSVSVPESHADGRSVPLVLSLHYGGERITQFFGNQMLHSMVKPSMSDLKPLIIAPDVINKSWSNFRCEECVMGLMNKVCETYNVDRDRVVVVGFSLGAEGAWHYAGKHPDFFKAAIPIGGRPPDDYLATEWKIPLLAIHSTADEVFPYRVVNEAITSLKARGDQVQIYALEGVSHYETTRFNEPLKEAAGWVKEVWDLNASRKELP